MDAADIVAYRDRIHVILDKEQQEKQATKQKEAEAKAEKSWFGWFSHNKKDSGKVWGGGTAAQASPPSATRPP